MTQNQNLIIRKNKSCKQIDFITNILNNQLKVFLRKTLNRTISCTLTLIVHLAIKIVYKKQECTNIFIYLLCSNLTVIILNYYTFNNVNHISFFYQRHFAAKANYRRQIYLMTDYQYIEKMATCKHREKKQYSKALPIIIILLSTILVIKKLNNKEVQK